MHGGQLYLVDAVFQPVWIIQIHFGNGGHTHNSVHGRTDVMAHIGQKHTFGLARIFHLNQRSLQGFFPL